MVTDGSHTCGELSIMYKFVESLCYTPKISVTSTIILKKHRIKKNTKWCDRTQQCIRKQIVSEVKTKLEGTMNTIDKDLR